MFLDQQILEWLVAKKKVTGKQASLLLAASENQSLELLLVERGMLDKQSLLDIKSMLCELKPVDLGAINIDLAVVRLLPSSMSRKFMALAYAIEDERLLVALANPTDPFARYFISMRTNREIEMRVAYLGDVQSLQDRAYPSEEPEVVATGMLGAPVVARSHGVQAEATFSGTSRRVNLPQEEAGHDSSALDAATHSLGRPQGARPSRPAPDAPVEPSKTAILPRGKAAAADKAGSGADPSRSSPETGALDIDTTARRKARESGRLEFDLEPRKRDTGRLESDPERSPVDPVKAPDGRKRDNARTASLLDKPHPPPMKPPEPFTADAETRTRLESLKPDKPAAKAPKPVPEPFKPEPEPVADKVKPPVDSPRPKRAERRSLELPSVDRKATPTVETLVEASAQLQETLEDDIEVVWIDDSPDVAPLPPAPSRKATRADILLPGGVSLLDSLSVMATNLAESGRLSYVVPQVLHTARILTGAQATAFLLCEPDRRYISFYATDGGGNDATAYAIPFDETTVAGWCVIRAEAINIKALRHDDRFSTSAEQAAGLFTGAVACVPVRWGPDILGALAAYSNDEVDLDMRPLLMLSAPLGAAVRSRQMESSIHDIRMETVQALLDWNEVGSPGARQHGAEVAQLATAMARYIALPPSDIEELCFAALLHDVGLIPDRERDRPDHPQRAGQILQKIRILQKMIPLVRYHHERYDGKGYPHGLKGEAIPLGARLLAIAEVYCEAGLHKVARDAPELETFLERFGTEFDPTLKAAFIRAVNLEEEPKPQPQS